MSANNSRNNKTFFNNFMPVVVTDKPLPGYTSSSSEIILITINATGTKLITTRTDRSIRIWRCFPERITDPHVIEDAHSKAVESISWDPNTEHSFASVGRDEYVKIWNGHTGALERQFKVVRDDKEEVAALKIVKYSSDGLVLITVDRDSEITFYSVENNFKQIYRLKDITEPIYDFQWFHNDHSFFILAFHNGNLPIYEFIYDEGKETETKLKTELTAHRSSATAVVIDPRGTYCAVGSGEGVVSLWNTKSMLHFKTISEVDESIACIDASRDGTYIAVSYDKGENIVIYDTVSGDRVYEVANSLSGQLTFACIAWFPSKTSFAYSSDEGTTLTVMRKPERNGRPRDRDRAQ
ncbi:WD40-repeat-containing domain protein [Scheffersomyces coipomensis]|uniref:WD40-repeat-containing domain protein n=1 Tax=Scheffersomyces coipomensis TaxID=1788519 RepID=UPI00315CB4C9